MSERTVLVEVTEEDIRKGRRENGTRCPVARAYRRATGLRGVYVDHVHVEVEQLEWIRRVPADVSRWIFRYDNHGTVEPTTFHMPVPS